MKALLFGSIGVVIDSSALQRDAYNIAFEEVGLDWHWDPEVYERLLVTTCGGQARLRHHAEREGLETPDDETLRTVHERKTEQFNVMLAEGQASARPGVCRLVASARERGVKLGFVTSTEVSNVEATLAASALTWDDFDVITHRDNVARAKPDPTPYRHALDVLGVAADEAVAIEDTGTCLRAAIEAGIATVATPNLYAGTQDFSGALAVLDHLGDGARAARHLLGRDIVRGGRVTLDSLASLLREEESESTSDKVA